MEEQKREFKGVWIPREIWLDKRLNMIEKGILTEIDSLDNEMGCSASNQYLAEFCQCSDTKVSLAIKKLIEMGYVYQESFNGRVRILKSRLSKFERQPLKICKAESQNLKENNIYNKLDNKDNNIYGTHNKEKHKYGEYAHVLLADEELDKLNEEYGEVQTQKAITYLDEYIEMKGAKYKSHYLALRKWVFDALKEKHEFTNYDIPEEK